ncbi:MAG TPA: hypothetical protein VH164_01135 [Ktedonobacteraceae bacterium]|jgi:hypothetical protein|nr:hypothetical protein [Ktedonobacteraceae bacterium]
MLIYILGAVIFFATSIPFCLHWSEDAEEAFIALLTSVCVAGVWPVAVPILLLVGVGKLLGCFETFNQPDCYTWYWDSQGQAEFVPYDNIEALYWHCSWLSRESLSVWPLSRSEVEEYHKEHYSWLAQHNMLALPSPPEGN